MKYIGLLLSLIITQSRVYSQELPVNSTTNKVSYADVVTVSGEGSTKLFAKAKKWLVTKNSEQNPYSITLENDKDGTLVGKGSFALPVDRRKYVVQFAVNIATKDGKCRYDLTDLVVQFRTKAGSSGGGWGYYSSSSYHEAETLEYSLETFYPSRLTSKKPVIEWYEEIRKPALATIDKEMQSIVSSLRQALTTTEDW